MEAIPRRRVVLLRLVLLAGFLLLIGRLIQLQVLRGDYFRHLSERNCLRARPLPAPRGRILDRRGRCLASSRAAFALWITPSDLPQERRPSVCSLLAEILNREASSLLGLLEGRGTSEQEPVLVQR